MPWKECHVMDERVRFIARLLEGETLAVRLRQVSIVLQLLSGRHRVIRELFDHASRSDSSA
jgi:hypothetical protein